jgi:AT hook motif.
MEARAQRQDRLNPTVKETVQIPNKKNEVKKENVVIKSNFPEVAVIEKRGRGRPRKVETEKINIHTKNFQKGKVPAGKGKGKK